MATLISPQLRRLLSYIRPYSFRMGAGVVLLAVVALAEGVVALMIAPMIDRVLTPSVSDSSLPLVTLPFGGPTIYLNHFFPASIHNVWTVLSISLLFVFVVKAISEFAGNMMVQSVGHLAVTDLRNHVYGRIIRQPIGFFQLQPAGRLISAVINDVERARLALSEYLADVFRQGFGLAVFLTVLLLIDWKMAVGSALFLPMILWPVGKLGRRIRRWVESSQARLGELSQILQETVGGNRVVKAFGMEGFETRRFQEAARRLMRETMRWVLAYVATSPIMDLLQPVVISLLLLYARDKIRLHQMTVGLFFAFVYALFKSYEPTKRIGAIYQQFQQARGATTQVFAYLDLAEEDLDNRTARRLPAFSDEIVFENVGFSYDSAPVLRRVDLRARRGEVVAIVGSSGAG
ncbi:MAG: ABC transporter transmembrane domain-containing protein, partial [bacterium]